MQCTYNITLKSVSVNIDAMEEQRIIFSECVRSLILQHGKRMRSSTLSPVTYMTPPYIFHIIS